MVGGEDGLALVDVSDPAQPDVVAVLEAFWHVAGIKITANTAYVTGDGYADKGIYILDVSLPHAPAILGFWEAPWGWNMPPVPVDVEVYEGFAFYGDLCLGGEIIDVSEPTSPQYVGQYGAGSPAALSVSGHGIAAIDLICPLIPDYPDVFFSYSDISDPLKPELLCWEYDDDHWIDWSDLYYSDALAHEGLRVLLAGKSRGLKILELSDCFSIFADYFEWGNTSRWSVTVGE